MSFVGLNRAIRTRSFRRFHLCRRAGDSWLGIFNYTLLLGTSGLQIYMLALSRFQWRVD